MQDPAIAQPSDAERARAKKRPFLHEWKSAVFNSQLSSAGRIALLALAEFADANGANCFPSIHSISKMAGLNEKTVRRVLADAVRDGWIERTPLQIGHGWRNWNYRICMPKGADTTPARSHKGADTTPARSDPTCGHSRDNVRTIPPERAGVVPYELALDLDKATGKSKETANADASASAGHASSKKKSTAKKKTQTLTEYLDGLAEGEAAIPEGDHSIFLYAKLIGLPKRFLYLAWCVFQRKHLHSAKRKADWPLTFMEYVRGCWLGLWFFKNGEYMLTTAGKQADLEEKALRDSEAAVEPIRGVT